MGNRLDQIADFRAKAMQFRLLSRDHYVAENFLVAAKLRQVAEELSARADALEEGL